MRYLSLFSGIGGIDLGLDRAGMTCVGQCEIDPFCRAVLAKHWPNVFRWSDVTDLPVELIRYVCGRIDLLCGGFACQDVSCAGKGAGIGRQTRSGVTWRNLFRLARGLRPAWLLLENVPALRSRGVDRVLRALERIGYSLRSVVVGAEHVGLPHKRHRVWIVGKLADPAGQHGEQWERFWKPSAIESGSKSRIEGHGSSELAHPSSIGPQAGNVPSGQSEVRSSTGCSDGFERLGGVRRESEELDSTLLAGPQEQHATAITGEPEERQSLRGTAESGIRGNLANAIGEQCDGGLPQPQRQEEERITSDRAGDQCNGQQRAIHSLQRSNWSDCGTDFAGADGSNPRCPARPGQQQHEWEAPRLIEFPVGSSTSGPSARLVRSANRHALKALGNAVVWTIPYLIGTWMIEQSNLKP